MFGGWDSANLNGCPDGTCFDEEEQAAYDLALPFRKRQILHQSCVFPANLRISRCQILLAMSDNIMYEPAFHSHEAGAEEIGAERDEEAGCDQVLVCGGIPTSLHRVTTGASEGVRPYH